ncbi:unnamed protein product [Rotaria sp. Silwood2]|nr:unnamed protein product [Rotaria sp. Silwood2]
MTEGLLNCVVTTAWIWCKHGVLNEYFHRIADCTRIRKTIDKIHLNSNNENYQRLLKLFYFYYVIQKSKTKQTTKSIEETNQNKIIVIEDTPQSPTMQDDSNMESNSIVNNSQLLALDIENILKKLNDNSLESRLQICSLFSISNLSDQQQQRLLSSTISSIYPKNLLHTLSPSLLRYIYDQKLLGQLLKYIQTTTTNERRWIVHNNKRKLDDEDNKLTDEQFIEKIIQHVSNITQWTDEQRRHAIYTYIIDHRQILLQAL